MSFLGNCFNFARINSKDFGLKTVIDEFISALLVFELPLATNIG